MEQEWRREMDTHHCISTKRTGLVWVSFGIWNVRGKMINTKKGRCLLCKDGENTLHILLKCNEREKQVAKTITR
jgi:hypothetical protein